MKNILLSISLLLSCWVAKAQDPHFSQFFASPLTLNPAYTGKFNGNYRIAGNFRNQWPEINNAFVTNTASADFHLLKNSIAPNDLLGIGVMLLNDKSAAGAVNYNYIAGSIAYHKGFDEEGNRQFGVGVQATYSNMLINTNQLVFEDQLTTLGFTNQTAELFKQNSLQANYFDINAGVLYTGTTGLHNTYYISLSAYHVNKPKLKLTGVDYTLQPRYTLQAGGYLYLSDMVGLHLSGLHSTQGGSTETLIGGTFQLTAIANEFNPLNVYAGSWMRLNDALIPYIGVEYFGARLGISYDVNTSALKTASMSKGGIEMSLIYTHEPNTDKPINCPKF